MKAAEFLTSVLEAPEQIPTENPQFFAVETDDSVAEETARSLERSEAGPRPRWWPGEDPSIRSSTV